MAIKPKLDSVSNSTAPDDGTLDDYTPVQLTHRADGWTAERQRRFLTALAETGCVTEACLSASVSARSAYRLRLHPKGGPFSAAWDNALIASSHRLTAIAFERAMHGAMRQVWKDGELVAETRQPSDKLLMFLLQHLSPQLFGATPPREWQPTSPNSERRQLVARLPDLDDVDLCADASCDGNFQPSPSGAERA